MFKVWVTVEIERCGAHDDFRNVYTSEPISAGDWTSKKGVIEQFNEVIESQGVLTYYNSDLISLAKLNRALGVKPKRRAK